MKYKVGDKVRVKGELSARDGTGITYAVKDMFKYRSKIMTIKDMRKAIARDYTIYTLDDNGEYWAWTEEMFEPAPKYNEIEKIIKEDKPMKFTFYVTEGTRVDKSCNGTTPTMTTTVEANSYSRTAPVGTATCDKADYDMRQGVLEALANMCCDGDFDKVYNKAVKRNEIADKKKRTCKYCGKVFDTVEEREAEEAWHVERKKARRERYLLRKRAKEIAFEEQAQKMAKKMIEEDK